MPNRAELRAGHADACSSSTPTTTRRPVTPIRSARASTTSSRSSAARRRSSAGTARTSRAAPAIRRRRRLIFTYQGGVTITSARPSSGTRRRSKFSFIVFSGITIDPTTGDLDFTNAVGDIAPAAGAGLYQYEVKITPPTLVVRSLKPTPKNPDGRAPLHAQARRGALRHERGRPERPGHVRRARRQRTAQGAGPARAGRGGDLHVEPPADREGQDVPRIRGGRVRGLESLAGVLGQGSLGTAACATPGASRLSPRCRRHHRDGLRIARPHAARRHRAGAARRCVRRPTSPALAKNAGNRVRVIVTLDDPPLAAATFARRLPGFGADAKLNFSSSFSRSYLGRLEAAQARAIASIREEIPEATVSRRYQVLVNGFAVSVPYERLPDLLEVEAANRVYPSYSYTLNLNRGPAVLGAPAFSGLTGARGDGVKVAVVDDGVDHEHPFLDPTGFSYPRGLSEGNVRLDDAEGDRGARLRGAGGEQHAARSRPLVPRHARRRDHRRRQDGRRGGAHGLLRRGVRAAVTRPSTTSRASRRAPTSATTASSTSPRRRRSAAAARRTAPRSSRPSRPPCATGWTSSTSRAAARRRIRGRTSSSRRSRTSFARASCRSSRPETTATSSGSGRRARPRPRPTRSAWAPSRTRTSSARR